MSGGKFYASAYELARIDGQCKIDFKQLNHFFVAQVFTA